MSIETVEAMFMSLGVALDDYVLQYGDDGVLLNTDVSTTEPFVDIHVVRGLDSVPPDLTERGREGMDGGFIDAEFEEARTVVIEGTIYAPTPEALEPFLDVLKGDYALSREPKPFYVQVPGSGIRVLYAKSLGVSCPWTIARRTGSAEFQIALKAEDPALYGLEIAPYTSLLVVNIGGRGYPRSYDYGYGTTDSSGGILSAVNEGNKPSNGEFTLQGPVTDPYIYNEDTGQTMLFDIVLSPTEFLVINLRNRTVKLNGEANRRYSLKGRNPWFLLKPGTNTFRFGGTQHLAGPPNARLTLTFRPAYR